MDGDQVDANLIARQITLEQAHLIFFPAISDTLEAAGLHCVAPLKWVSEDHAPFRRIFHFEQRRVSGLMPSWGMSLDFVPKVGTRKVTWKRNSKNASVTLGAYNSLSTEWGWGINPFADDSNLNEYAQTRLIEATAEALNFWNSHKNLDQCLQWFDNIRITGSFGHHRGWPVNEAFCLGEAGKFDQAEKMLIEESKNFFQHYRAYDRESILLDLLSGLQARRRDSNGE